MSLLLLEFKSPNYARAIQKITSKESSDSQLCQICWKILPPAKLELHNQKFPEHLDQLFERSQFSSERDFVLLAKKCNKIFKKGTQILFVNPCNFETQRRNLKALDKAAAKAEKDSLNQSSLSESGLEEENTEDNLKTQMQKLSAKTEELSAQLDKQKQLLTSKVSEIQKKSYRIDRFRAEGQVQVRASLLPRNVNTAPQTQVIQLQEREQESSAFQIFKKKTDKVENEETCMKSSMRTGDANTYSEMTDDEASIKSKKPIKLPRIVRKNMKLMLSRCQGQLFVLPHPSTVQKEEFSLSEVFCPFFSAKEKGGK